MERVAVAGERAELQVAALHCTLELFTRSGIVQQLFGFAVGISDVPTRRDLDRLAASVLCVVEGFLK
jgi:hypothetical protein